VSYYKQCCASKKKTLPDNMRSKKPMPQRLLIHALLGDGVGRGHGPRLFYIAMAHGRACKKDDEFED
jgi:hypothetical protein